MIAQLTLFGGVPVGLAALLAWRFPEYRRASWRSIAASALLVLAFGVACVYGVAQAAGSRVLLGEGLVLSWFVITVQLAFWLWDESIRKRVERRWLRALLLTVVVLPALVSALLTHRLKWGDAHDPRLALGLPFEHVTARTQDGLDLAGWFLPEPGSDRTLLVFHGAGANKGDFVWMLGALARQGYNLALFDSRAHGASEGRQTTWGVREQYDVRAVVDWLVRTHPEAAQSIVGLGCSQGALALALAGAHEPRLKAFVFDSPFVSLRHVAHGHAAMLGPLGPALADFTLAWMSAWTGTSFFAHSAAFDMAALGTRPVLVITGAEDALIPRTHGEALLREARGPRAYWLGPGAHGNVVSMAKTQYADHVFDFLRRNLN